MASNINLNFSIDKENVDSENGCFQFDLIKQRIFRYQNSIYYRLLKNIRPTDAMVTYWKSFSIDGSIILPKSLFDQTAPDFFRRSRRSTEFREFIHLRGTRYTISTNPTFELRQKLQTLKDDFYEGLDALKTITDVAYRVAIADYIKNAALTILNSYIYEEKIGRFKFGSISYQNLRHNGIILCQSCVDLFYLSLVGRWGTGINSNSFIQPQYTNALKALVEILDRKSALDEMIEAILTSYQEGTFSSRHMTRPEAAHPITICATVAGFVKLNPFTPDTIVGMPSGSTELALAFNTAYRSEKFTDCKVLLMPASLHSVKRDFDETKSMELRETTAERFVKKHKNMIENQKVLLTDDNSSTGRTISLVAEELISNSASEIKVVVSEADLIRSKIDLKNPERTQIASPEIYKYSVSILPVSKKIKPKFDIKEMLEQKKSVACIKGRYFSDNENLKKTLIGKVYIDLIANPIEKVLQTTSNENLISSFKGTFLSNFAKVQINYLGKTYDSVEHCYQAMKFEPGVLENIKGKDIDRINAKIRSRGIQIGGGVLPYVFEEAKFSAGTSKIIANQLRRMGFVRSDWDNAKIHIMMELLIQKFSNKEYYKLLKNTSDKYLIEGNDWGDTYWGVVDGRGRNVLGRALMFIRDLPHKTLEEESKRIEKVNTGWVA